MHKIQSWLPLLFLFGLINGCRQAPPLPVIEQLPTLTPTAANDETPIAIAPTTIGTEVPLGVSFATIAPPTAVVIQTTPSPLPPPTATATPTPIVYQITDGDTILGIAINQFTTTDDILTLNPEVNPNLLSIGQEIILPPPATAVFGGNPATPIPLNIDITSIQTYQNPFGTSWIVGEVKNSSPHYVEDIRLELTLIGESGNNLGKIETWTAFSLLSPEETAPFAILVADTTNTIEQIQSAVVAGRAFAQLESSTDSRTLDFQISDVAIVSIESGGEITGRITNSGTEPADNVQITMTLYDNQNGVTGFGQLTLENRLEPDQSATFSLNLASPGGVVADVIFHVQGIRP